MFKNLTTIFFIVTLVGQVTCKKNAGPDVDTPGTGNGNTVPIDPPIENTIGFFLDNWSPKNFVYPAVKDTSTPAAAATTFVTVDAGKIITKIPSSIYGHNANIWMTQMVTEAPLMTHIKNLSPQLIRFPGGGISDIFFWNAPVGQPPADAPATLQDAAGMESPSGFWYGKNADWWTMSVDNYYNMLQQTGNKGMITVNYGYARYSTASDPVAKAAHLAADWVRYDKGRTKYWEIGNESNGTWEAGYRINTANNRDGQPQIITGALYAQHARVFIDSMRKAATEIGASIYIGVYLLEKQPENWQTETDKNWNKGVLTNIGNHADYYVVHSYYTPYKTNAAPDEILLTATNNTLAMMQYVKNQLAAYGAAVKPIALNEWNITSEGSMQQVSYINGMHAAILLGEAIKNKYGMAGRWDLANAWDNGNDHGLFNIGDEPGGVSKWNPRPAFFYMYYFNRMMGDRLLDANPTGTSILAYASSFSSGQIALTLINKSNTTETVQVTQQNFKAGNYYYWYTLTGGTDNGAFSRKVFVNGIGPAEPTGGPSQHYSNISAYRASTASGIKLTMLPRTVTYMVMDK